AIDAFPGIVVAASGNDSVDVGATPQYPCAYTSSNVICVGASTQNDTLASFSNYNATSVDLAAPGENIIGLLTLSAPDDYYIGDGTSFATPQVAGTVGLLWSQNPSASITTVRNTLLASSDHKTALSGKITCGRRLNANAALANMQSATIPSGNCSSPVYRFWSDTKQGHFFTASTTEKDYIIANYPDNVWHYEGVGFNAYADQISGTTPVYRFWSDTKQHHFYTASEDEKNYVISTYPTNVWKYEGIAYYAFNSPQSNTTPIYRFWSDTKQGHFYTASENEKNYIIANYPLNVWKYESVAWYVPTN
ncbi:MAG: S8 family serine peptidase, partial [Parcubacteria group bacterium]